MTGLAETLLDNKSSTKQKSLRPTYRETMLATCEDDILAIEYIYSYFDQRDHTEKMFRLNSCRTGAFFVRNCETGQIRVASQSCKLRHCPLCTKSKTLVIKQNVTAWLKFAKYPKLLTFTLKHSDENLRSQIDRLYESFKEIRRLKILKKKCRGGIWFFQVKKSKTDGLFHPHLHCLISGSFIPQREIARKWLKITGDSQVVDIRQIKSPETAARHVSRYAAKPCSLKHLSLDECIELAEALEKRRLCGTWGICRKLKLTSPPELEKENWYRIGSWNAVYETKDFDVNAAAILKAWQTGTPLEENIDMDHLFEDESDSKQSSERGSPTIEYQTFFEWRS